MTIGSISLIDNRGFPDAEDVVPPGPVGYQLHATPTMLSIIPNLMFSLNDWLADAMSVGSLFDHAHSSGV